MNRPAGVIVIAVLSLLASALTLLMGILMVALAIFAPVPNDPGFAFPPTFFKALMGLISLLYLLPSVWGIASGIGLFGLKNWARISTIVFSILLILMGGFDSLIFLVMPNLPTRSGSQALDPAFLSAMRIGMAGFSFGLLAIGAWWLIYLTRPRIKQLFVPASTVTVFAPRPSLTPMQPDPAFAMPATVGRPQRPLSFTVLAWFLVVCTAFLPVNLVLHAPVMFFTVILTGRPAIAVYFAFAAVCLYIGVGLLRFKPLARSVAVGYFIFNFINFAVFYLAPGRRARMQARSTSSSR